MMTLRSSLSLWRSSESWKDENEMLCVGDLQFIICQDLMTLSSLSPWRSSVCNLS